MPEEFYQQLFGLPSYAIIFGKSETFFDFTKGGTKARLVIRDGDVAFLKANEYGDWDRAFWAEPTSVVRTFNEFMQTM
jgi:hypothetical protein